MYRNKLNKIWNLIDTIKNDITLPIISDFLEWFYEKININFNKKEPKLNLNKWEIYFVNLWKNIWSELNKNRPCIIISKTYFNKTNTVIVIPIKSYKWKISRSTQIIVDLDFLNNKSIIDILAIRQIDKKRINNYIWTIWKENIVKIDKKLWKILWIKSKKE